MSKAIIFNTPALEVHTAIETIFDRLSPLVDGYTKVDNGCMGTDTIMLLLSFEPREKWSYGHVENSNYMRIAVEQNGEVECFTQSLYPYGMDKSYATRLPIKLRKFTAKSFDVVLTKLAAHVEKVKKGLNGEI